MKKTLFIVNCILGILIFIVLISNLASMRSSGQTFEVKKRSAKKGQTQEVSKRTTLEIPVEKQLETIVNSDIFNPERAPNVAAWGRGRTQISLVGTFKVGKMEGAIILQQGAPRFPGQSRMGAMMSHDAMMQMMQQGAGNMPRPGNMQGAGNMQGGMRRMGSMRQRWSMLNPQLARQLAGENQNPTAIKQYVRVGETLANGGELSGLEVGEAQRGEGFVFVAESRKLLDQEQQFALDDLQRFTLLDEFGVVSDIAAGGSQVDDGGGGGAEFAQSADVAHHVVTELFFDLGDPVEVDIFQMGFEFGDLFVSDGESESLFVLSQGEPEAAPGGVFVLG